MYNNIILDSIYETPSSFLHRIIEVLCSFLAPDFFPNPTLFCAMSSLRKRSNSIYVSKIQWLRGYKLYLLYPLEGLKIKGLRGYLDYIVKRIQSRYA